MNIPIRIYRTENPKELVEDVLDLVLTALGYTFTLTKDSVHRYTVTVTKAEPVPDENQ